MLALGIKIIRNAKTEIRNAEVEKVFGKAGLSLASTLRHLA
jgi:hypothetical protein